MAPRRRSRRRRRRGRRPLRRAVRRPRGRARHAGLRPPARRDRLLLGAGRARRRARRRGLARSATSRTRSPPAAGSCAARAAEVLCEEAPERFRDLERARRALRRRPPRQPRARPRGRPRRPPRRARGRQRDRPPDPAHALGASSPSTRGSRCSRAAAPPRWRCDGRAPGCCSTTARAIGARAVVLATGGAAALWSRTTNPPGSFGSGLLLARAAGAALADLEFVQFHPTAVVGLPGPRGLPDLRGGARRGRHAARRRRRALRRRARAARRGRARDLQRAARARARASVGLDMRGVDPGRFPNVVAALREAGPGPDAPSSSRSRPPATT